MELKELQEKLDATVASFKKSNDELLAKVGAQEQTIKTHGEMREKVEKANSDITKLELALKDACAAIKRGNANGGKEESPAEVKKYRDALVSYLRTGNVSAEAKTQALEAYAAKSMTVDNDPNGGFLVSPDTSGRIVTQVYESSPIRQLASVQTINSDALEGMYDLDQVSSGWVAERDTRAVKGSPAIGRYRIPVNELYAEPQISQKLLDDASIDLEAWLADKVSQKFARDEAAAFVNGTGVGQPRGFTTYADGTTLPYGGNAGTIEQVGSASSGLVTADFLFDLVYKMKALYRQGAVFAMPRLVIDQARKLKDQQLRYLWEPSLQAGEPGTLLGFPVQEFNDLPAAAGNSLSVAFANFKIAYQIVDRIGIRTLRDNLTVKGQIILYTTKRVGGDVVNFEAIKLGKLG